MRKPKKGAPLTATEIRTLVLAATGATNGELARMFSVSPGTINARMDSIYAKMGARNRVHAVTLGFRSGLLR